MIPYLVVHHRRVHSSPTRLPSSSSSPASPTLPSASTPPHGASLVASPAGATSRSGHSHSRPSQHPTTGPIPVGQGRLKSRWLAVGVHHLSVRAGGRLQARPRAPGMRAQLPWRLCARNQEEEAKRKYDEIVRRKRDRNSAVAKTLLVPGVGKWHRRRRA